MSAAEPTAVTALDGPAARWGRRRELRRALGDQRVARADEAPGRHLAGDDDLAPVAERVGDRAAVDDGQGAPAAVAVADLEVQEVAAALDRAGRDLAGELVVAAGRRGRQQLRRRHGIAGGG